MSDTTSQIYFADTKAKAVFAADGPKPQFLIDTPNFKALVAGLEAGGQIPAHPGEAAMYHFLEGAGLMTVGDEAFEIKPGVTVVLPSGMALSLQSGLIPIAFGGSGASLPADFFAFTSRMLHGFIAPALLLLVVLHVGAALYHQFLLKDNLLARMWYGK